MINQLYKSVKNELTSYNRYESGQLKLIGVDNYQHSDYVVKNKLSFLEWIGQKDKMPIIKIEGIENIKKVKSHFTRCNNIHLFVHQKTCYSFNWHKDDVNVYLVVLKGKKIVYVKSKKIVLKSGQGVCIPKGHLHKVFSNKGTWALSVGYK